MKVDGSLGVCWSCVGTQQHQRASALNAAVADRVAAAAAKWSAPFNWRIAVAAGVLPLGPLNKLSKPRWCVRFAGERAAMHDAVHEFRAGETVGKGAEVDGGPGQLTARARSRGVRQRGDDKQNAGKQIEPQLMRRVGTT
jgi:hypothetical protein